MGWASRTRVRSGNPQKVRIVGAAPDQWRARAEFEDGFTHVRLTYRDGTHYVMDKHGQLHRRDYEKEHDA